MSWEIIKNSQGDKYFRQINSNKLSTFRWPFYAYAMSQNRISISPLAKPEFMVHHRLKLKDSDSAGSI